MVQMPILKDGVVVNVIEIDGDTAVVTKEEHTRQFEEETAAYEAQLATWRQEIRQRHSEAEQARSRLAMARMTMEARKVAAKSQKADAGAAMALQQIFALEEEVEQHAKALMVIEAVPLPAKPPLIRAKRWFYPDGLEVGPAGGNIGDIWDGKEYVRPAKPKLDEAAQPVA